MYFWPKKGQKVKFLIFHGKNNFAIFLKTNKLVFMAKISKILWTDLEKLVKMAVFGPKWPFLDRFWPKMAILTNFSKSVHRILLIFAIETNFLVFKNMAKKFPRKKSEIWLFGPFLTKIWPFLPKNGHFDLFFQIKS